MEGDVAGIAVVSLGVRRVVAGKCNRGLLVDHGLFQKVSIVLARDVGRRGSGEG